MKFLETVKGCTNLDDDDDDNENNNNNNNNKGK
jgi:hypothetical protein